MKPKHCHSGHPIDWVTPRVGICNGGCEVVFVMVGTWMESHFDPIARHLAEVMRNRELQQTAAPEPALAGAL